MTASILASQQPTFRGPGMGGGVKSARATVIPIGDSRVPWVLDTATLRQKGATDMANVACALSDQKYTTPAGYGMSGKRIDEYLVNLPTAIALNPGVILFPSVLNSIGQNYPTASTSGTDAADRIKAAAATCIAAGIVVIVGSEIATTTTGAAIMGQINIYNALMQQAANTTPGLYFVDVRSSICDGLNNVLAEFVYDGTHLNQRGALKAGRVWKSLLDQLMPANAGFVLNASGVPAVGGFTNLCQNPRFATTTGGSTSTGVTGTFAANSTFNKTGANVAAVVASALENVVIDCTFSTGVVPGTDNVRMAQAPLNASWNSGETVRGMALVEVAAGATGLAGIELNLVANGDSVSTIWADMATVALAGWNGPNDAVRYLLLTQPYVIPTYTTKGSLAPQVFIRPNGVGSARVTVKQIGVLRPA